MKLVIEKMSDLQALYVKELRSLLSAEELIAIKSPIMAEIAEDPELVRLLREHILETQTHIDRLREILHRATGEADPLKCKVAYALFDEVQSLIEDAAHVPIRDAALVTEARRIEHYEIAAYEALLQIATILRFAGDVSLLDRSLREEEGACRRLALIAERIYPAAQKAA